MVKQRTNAANVKVNKPGSLCLLRLRARGAIRPSPKKSINQWSELAVNSYQLPLGQRRQRFQYIEYVYALFRVPLLIVRLLPDSNLLLREDVLPI